MTRRSKAIRMAVAGLAVLVLAGCGKPAGRHARTVPGGNAVSSDRSTSPAVPQPAGERAALDAVAVARAFTAAVCPYSWRDPVPYGQRVNAALARWGTPAFAAAHRWSPARTAAAAAALVQDQAEQTCGQVTGGLDPEPAAGDNGLVVRLSVTVTAHGQGSAASSTQEPFDLQLVPLNGGWLISSGRW